LTVVWLGFGANLGDRQANIERALVRVEDQVRISRRSDLVETEPVRAEGPDYLNCVAEGETELAPIELLDFTQEIEREMGRSAKGTNAPRPIDIDILFFGDRIVRTPRLSVPHPRLHVRPFVLDPLRAIEPGLLHPLLGRTVEELAELLP
jgi:2-amino-4-hydroxy-6-hydroxymethyldihydropteridine diphosphokinase